MRVIRFHCPEIAAAVARTLQLPLLTARSCTEPLDGYRSWHLFAPLVIDQDMR